MTVATSVADAAELANRGQFAAAVELYYEAVTADPTDVEAHKGLAMTVPRAGLTLDPDAKYGIRIDEDAMKAASERLTEFYDGLMLAHPDDAVVSWARAGAEKSYVAKEPWLLKAIALNPKFAQAYADLASIEGLRGHDDEVERLLGKAVECSPEDAALRMTQAYSTKDAQKKAAFFDEIAARFPGTEQAATALAAGAGAEHPDEAKARLLRLREQFPPETSQVSARAMSQLLSLYEQEDAQLALAFAAELAQLPGAVGQQWTGNADALRAKLDAQEALASGDSARALELVEAAVAGRPRDNELPLLKARALGAADRADEAVEELIAAVVETPDVNRVALAAELSGRTVVDLTEEVWRRREAASTDAPPLSLGYIDADDSFDLADHQGSVVWVSFFYPGCGPCRHEFPYLQRITEALADQEDFLLVAVNGIEDQREFAAPLLRATGCTFRALDGGSDTNKDWDVSAFPSNFVVGRNGLVVYRPHVYDDTTCTEALLQIKQLLARPSA